MQGDLTALIERVEKVPGPDRRLDAEIMCAFHGYAMHEESDPANGIFAFWDGEPWKSTCHNCTIWPEVTASLDEALALVEETLPGWDWSLRHSVSADGDVRYGNAVLWVPSDPRDDEAPRHWANHSSPVLALLLAMLLALQADRSPSPTEGDADA